MMLDVKMVLYKGSKQQFLFEPFLQISQKCFQISTYFIPKVEYLYVYVDTIRLSKTNRDTRSK